MAIVSTALGEGVATMVNVGAGTARVGVVEGEGADVDEDVGTSNMVAVTTNVPVGVGVTVLTHPAIISPANNRSNGSDKGFLFMGQTFVRCLDRSAQRLAHKPRAAVTRTPATNTRLLTRTLARAAR